MQRLLKSTVQQQAHKIKSRTSTRQLTSMNLLQRQRQFFPALLFTTMTSVARGFSANAHDTTSSTISEAGSTVVGRTIPTSTSHVQPVDENRRKLLKSQTGGTIEELEPIGASVYGVDLKQDRPTVEVIKAMETEMANRGFLVFKHQHDLSSDELVEATKWWGGQEMHSTHGVHPATPPGRNMQHIFRLSNDRQHGILGVGPQWHNDGSFEAAPFSHVAYHIVRVAENGGGTHFTHQGAAYDQLSPEDQEFWSRLSSVNSNSGVVHPLVHEHPVTGRKCVWLHMGMTGAVIEHTPEGEYRVLEEEEMKKLFSQYSNLLTDGLAKGYGKAYEYEEGDVLFIDNYAVGHRASPEAHLSAKDQGLRIMHRATCKAPFEGFEPRFGLPQYININGPNPFGRGVWIGGGIGFKHDPNLHYQN